MRDLIYQAAAFGLLALLATGLYAWPATTWTPGYFQALQLHRIAGFVTLAVGLPALFVHLQRTKSGPWGPMAILALGLLATLPAVSIFDKLPEDRIALRLLRPFAEANPDPRVQGERSVGPSRILECIAAFRPDAETKGDYRCFELGSSLALLALLGGAAILAAASFLFRHDYGDAGRWSGNGALLLTGWALGSGVLITFARREHWLFGGLTLHSVAGVGALSVLGLHLANRAGGLQAKVKPWVAVPAASMSLLVVAGLWWVQYDWEHMGGYREGEEGRRLVTISAPVLLADRQAYGQPNGPGVRIDPSWIVPSVGCGASGCHQRIYEQWAGSAHRFSADNKLYRATVALGVEAGGAQVAVLCANCHDPARSLTGEVGVAYARGAPEAPSDGVGCVICHAITGSHDSEPRNGNFDYAFGRPYPGGEIGRRWRIRLDPRDHRQTHVHASALLTAEGCMGCHRVELGPETGSVDTHVLQEIVTNRAGSSVAGATCTPCHLPFDSEGRYGHRMAGIAADLPRFAIITNAADRARVESHGDAAQMMASLDPPQDLTNPKWKPIARTRPVLRLTLSGEAKKAGDGVSLQLRALSERGAVGHRFPSGPMDLTSTWMEIAILDANGKLIHHVGSVDREGTIDPRAPRLGGEELNAEDQPIDRHRLWTITKIEKFGQVGDEPNRKDLELPIPADVRWPLEVRARWLYRRVNPEFVHYALGPDAALFPSWELSAASIGVTLTE